MRKFKIFYSWQSDLPGDKNRNFIRKCIDKALDLAEDAEAIDAVREEATSGVTGSPDIVATLFSKIDDCDFFIADISLCYTETQKGEKKSPNPNVMFELGYAVKKLGWERVLCVCNAEYGKEYPFDIAHNRITNYTLKNKNKNEVISGLSIIIFKNIRDIRKLKPVAKAGMSTHIIGAYDSVTRTVVSKLSPIDITNQEGYILHNQKLIDESRQLVDEIQNISISLKAASDACGIKPQTYIKTADPSNPYSIFDALDGSKVPVLWKEEDLNKMTIKEWLDIDVSDEFFDLGNLKRTLNITKSSLLGSNEEIKKYEKLRELEYKISMIRQRNDYLKSFDDMYFIPLAIQNISAVQDENIRVVVNVNQGDIVEPDEHLIWSELEGAQGHFCRDDDNEQDVGIICELFALPEDGRIHIEEDSNNPSDYTPRKLIFTENGAVDSPKDEKDYELELQEFIAKTDGHGYYEFDVENLRPNECKWLCCGMLIKPVDDTISISYQIHSTHSSGEIEETLEWHKNDQ